MAVPTIYNKIISLRPVCVVQNAYFSRDGTIEWSSVHFTTKYSLVLTHFHFKHFVGQTLANKLTWKMHGMCSDLKCLCGWHSVCVSSRQGIFFARQTVGKKSCILRRRSVISRNKLARAHETDMYGCRRTVSTEIDSIGVKFIASKVYS